MAETDATDDDGTSFTDSLGDDGGFGTFLNALLGAVVGVVLPFPPFSHALGGALAGYLQGPDLRDGAVVGALAGVLSSLFWVPVLFVFVVLFGVFEVPAGVAGFTLIVFLVFALAASAFVVAAFAVGGALGGYAKREGLLEDL